MSINSTTGNISGTNAALSGNLSVGGSIIGTSGVLNIQALSVNMPGSLSVAGNINGNVSNSVPVVVSTNTYTVSSSECTLLVNTALIQQKGLDIDGLAGDFTGFNVSLSDDGNTMATGAIFSDANGVDSGASRVFDWNESVWIQRGLDIVGEAAGDGSGRVSLSADGNTIAIGASANGGNGANSGHVRVFDWSGSAWVQRGLDIDGESAGDGSGAFIALSSSGDTVLIGANGGNSGTGHARVYDWSGSAWVQRGLDIDGSAMGDNFGSDVAISNNSDTIAIGAPFAPVGGGGGSFRGYVRIFDWSGSAWVQRGSDINGLVNNQALGGSLSFSSDGDTLGIGVGPFPGSVLAKVYAWSGSAWVQKGSDFAGNAMSGDTGVALSSDGNTIAVSNASENSSAGVTRLFSWNDAAWVQNGEDIIGEAPNDRSGLSGTSVAISADGSMFAVGSGFNADGGVDAGHVRIWTYNGTVVLTLPAASSLSGKIIYIKSNYIELLSNSSNIVHPFNTPVDTILLKLQTFAMLQSDGTNWLVLLEMPLLIT
jgi:hypothetical protein